MSQYTPQSIEKKWQARWEEQQLYKASGHATRESKMYILPQLPYPSGSGLHVGHAEVYTACDIFARYQRMLGKDVLQVIGWDSFGLPAENYAIKTNVHPRINTDKAIENFRSQIKLLGISVDWDREVGSHNADYYKWTQWFFLLMYKRGLAYRKKQAVNWCDSCKTVLANEQVVDGACERCDTTVLQKEMEQWYLKITEYADRLIDDLDKVDWPQETITRQRNWIGRSYGAEVQFTLKDSAEKVTVFTTRPDTLFGATYMVLAPEHPLVAGLKDKITNYEDVQAYVAATEKKSNLERQIDQEKTGVELKGVKALNPATNEEIPVWIADYVLATYGTGAIMAVPAHDERDFAFAKKFGLEVRQVIAPYYVCTGELAPQRDKETTKRNVVSAIIRNTEGKYLLLRWKGKFVGFVGGGVEDGETAEEAILREVREETGYLHAKIVREAVPTFFGHGYKPRKNVNCFDPERAFLVQLIDDAKQETSEADGEEHDILWVDESEVANQLVLDHHKCIWEWNSKEDHVVTEEGIAINSDFLNDLTTEQAKEKMIAHLEEHNIGKKKTQYKLRDWSVSRQRFWGAPIPMLYDDEGGMHPVPEADLPVILPDDVDFKPTGQSPLTYSPSFQDGVEEKYGKGWKREVDTLDTFMCSSWYFFRYLDPKNDQAFASPEALKTWMPVDFYLGGEEHVNGHLLYARFFTKVLFDEGLIDFDEPFLKNRHQGLISGEDGRKMSKRWGNVINPTDVVNEYGADTIRMYEMFMGPLDQTKSWSTGGVKGIRRFLEKVWKLQEKLGTSGSEEMNRFVHKTIKKVTADTASLSFNTAISAMMECANAFTKEELIDKEQFAVFITLLAPYAPHMAEEVWEALGQTSSVTIAPWPMYDESVLILDTVEIAVQVNGKLRATMTLAVNASEDEAFAAALAEENVLRFIEGKELKKQIYVPGRIVNLVV